MGKYAIYRVYMKRNPKIYPNATTEYYNLFYMACPEEKKSNAKEWMLNVAAKCAGFENIDEYISAFPHQFNSNTAAGSLYVTTALDESEICDTPKELFKNNIEYDVVHNWYGWITMQFFRTEVAKTLCLLSHLPIYIEEAVGAVHTMTPGSTVTRDELWFCDDWCEE